MLIVIGIFTHAGAQLLCSAQVWKFGYGWLLGFGRKAKIISPLEAVEEFKTYVDKVREMYVEKDGQ